MQPSPDNPHLATVSLMSFRHQEWSDDHCRRGPVPGMQDCSQQSCVLIQFCGTHPTTFHEITPDNDRHVWVALQKLQGAGIKKEVEG